MTAVVRGWAPDPHDADLPEESCACAWCGRSAEDGADVDATREEAENCLPRVSLDHYGKIRLCDECNAQRSASWEADDIASALMPDKVRHDERDARIVVQLLQEVQEVCERNRWPFLLLAIPVGEGGRIDRCACSGLLQKNPEVARVIEASEEAGYILLRATSAASQARKEWAEIVGEKPKEGSAP